MKELKPLVRTRYKCDFCNHIYVRKDKCLAHEKTCYKNPERICRTCNNTGIETFHTPVLDGSPLDLTNMHMKTETRPCSSCGIAKQLGGKSYV